MKLEVVRFSSQKKSTLGMLFDVTKGRHFLCFTLEDPYRKVKVKGKTRIPAGSYRITFRTEGTFHQKYRSDFKSIHKGMLWIRNVPNFTYILIHVGNWAKNTKGCLLVADKSEENVTKGGFVGNSATAYKRIYPPIAAALEAGEQARIKFVDYESV